MEAIKDILGMAVVGVMMTIAIPFVFLLACLWQLGEIWRGDNKWRLKV